MSGILIVQFLVLTFFVSGVIIFVLHRTLISSTEGAVNRLNSETESARTKQAELNRKIKEADEELVKRKAEADEVVKKMMEDAEEAAKNEQATIVGKARKTAEDVITKAQRTKDIIRKDIEKEVQLQMINECVKIMEVVFSERARQVFSEQLVREFIEELKKVDAHQINLDADAIDVVVSQEISEGIKKDIEDILLGKLGRKVVFNYQVDPKICGGAILRFGTLALNGSLANIFKETAISMKMDIEKE
ncbi:MAG: F0F1 ATP synthase subunit delta [Candidatus Aceula lacicola]|nr:F0F1 ATP synthase subunit delta [Candidatus Aceula lacicola]